MIVAYKEHFQFILILAVMYVLGVWGGPLIYPVYPLFLFLFGLKGRYFELLIVALWTLMLADYVPVENATHDDLQFAKDLKPLVPLILFLFFIRDRHAFKPYNRTFVYFLPFIISVTISLMDSINVTTGIQKTISYAFMYLTIPLYVTYLHRQDQERFWKALLTFIIGMLSIGIVLRFAAPDIAMLKGGRYKGVLGNPNGLGVFLNLTFMLWTVIREYKLATFTKKENIYIFVVIFISLIWSGSRNGMMSIFLFYAVYKIIQVNWFLALLVLASMITFNDQLFEVLLGTVEFFGLEDYFRVESIEEGSGRKVAWVFAWSEIQNYFFMGGGFGHDENIMRPNYYWLSRLGHQGGVHNSYLSLWFDAGIVGIVAYFGGFLTMVFKAMKHNYLVLAFAASIAFNVNFESWLVASLNPFTIVMLMIIAIFVGNLTGADYEQQESSLNHA